ncbi:PREDICTED: acyl-CoA Delta(11) desaturase-like, partial [Polistes canadensis]|uniref:acyl-CoA Delta(11) desaturase-like n=1 Tax=Polistes canadensis TaxID=91411 RepID=UPI000718FA31
KWNIDWFNVIFLIYFHIACLYGIYFNLTSLKLYTAILAIITIPASILGITAGAHRLWAHKAYKAKWPMRIILMILESLAFERPIYIWVRYHRIHHKYTDTDADPHNSKRGFFFSHFGWLMLKKHPEVIKKGATIDMSDLEKDPLVMWQLKYANIFMSLVCFVIPTLIPVFFWGESLMNAWYATTIRYIISLNAILLVNSAAHMWGTKPYDNSISPTNSLSIGIAALGEGWHNYHHVFPWDYKASELGNYKVNLTTAFIDGFTKLGWAYDLKTVSHEMIEKRACRTGDGTSYQHVDDQHEHKYNNSIWGLDDPDIITEDLQDATILDKAE